MNNANRNPDANNWVANRRVSSLNWERAKHAEWRDGWNRIGSSR